jgi:hypothetical protein
VNLKTRAEGIGSAEKPRSDAGEGGKPNTLEAGVRLEYTGNTWELLDSPPEEDKNGSVPITATNEGSNLKESPTKTDEAGLPSSVAPNAVTSKPPGGKLIQNQPRRHLRFRLRQGWRQTGNFRFPHESGHVET